MLISVAVSAEQVEAWALSTAATVNIVARPQVLHPRLLCVPKTAWLQNPSVQRAVSIQTNLKLWDTETVELPWVNIVAVRHPQPPPLFPPLRELSVPG
ncbi:hypothetical protein A2V61_03760 [Candidatus Woesebacteria bacterium RBG_19FT_COMBO_47_8]|nr:MAG: hypothetical protein A2V61_03760 [Candidatus Woesebacteria bacterium RBG_19FT_COMBO_47_8]